MQFCISVLLLFLDSARLWCIMYCGENALGLPCTCQFKYIEQHCRLHKADLCCSLLWIETGGWHPCDPCGLTWLIKIDLTFNHLHETCFWSVSYVFIQSVVCIRDEKSVGSKFQIPVCWWFLLLDEAVASRAIFVIVSRSDSRAEMLLEPTM